MAMITTLPVNHRFNGPDSHTSIICDVTAGSMHIQVKKDSTVVHDGEYSGDKQGTSAHYSTNVDQASWEINITGSPLTTFVLTAPG